MIIEYTRPKSHSIHFVIGKNEKGDSVCREQVFSPGNNEVSKDNWDKIKIHPLIRPLIKSGVFKVVLGGDNKSLAELDIDEAANIIKSTYAVPLLESFKVAEKRKEVLKAVDEQIKSLEVKDEESEEGIKK